MNDPTQASYSSEPAPGALDSDTEVQPGGEQAETAGAEADPTTDSAEHVEVPSADAAAGANAGTTTPTDGSKPGHEYQVTHKTAVPGDPASFSQHTSAWHSADDAINYIRTHVFGS